MEIKLQKSCDSRTKDKQGDKKQNEFCPIITVVILLILVITFTLLVSDTTLYR